MIQFLILGLIITWYVAEVTYHVLYTKEADLIRETVKIGDTVGYVDNGKFLKGEVTNVIKYSNRVASVVIEHHTVVSREDVYPPKSPVLFWFILSILREG